MRAMILAAGRGMRMMPFTAHTPKPLLVVHGKPLIVWHIIHLVKAGIVDIVINHAYLGEQIEALLEDGTKWGARICYSREDTPLETAGGIAKALPLLGEEPFLVISADIYCPTFDFTHCFAALTKTDLWGNPLPKAKQDMAWLYLVNNPSFHPKGDFVLRTFTVGAPEAYPDLSTYTYGNIGVYRPEMFINVPTHQVVKLATLLHPYIARGQIGGEIIACPWVNVGTPQELLQLNQSGNK